MIAVRWAGIVTILAVIAGLWHTQSHNGLVIVGLVALGFVLWTFDVFTVDFWVHEIPAEPSRFDQQDRPGCCMVDHAESGYDDEEQVA